MSIFSQIDESCILFRGNHFFIIKDGFPVSPGHLLIISNREIIDFFLLTLEEQQELVQLISTAKQIILKSYQPDGFNIGMNCGEAAGQTVMHFHCHVIPRYQGDMENPRGGVRHCIAGKGNY